MKRQLLGVIGIMLLSVQTVCADNLVLVQGYLGDGSAWRSSGVASQLVIAGWTDEGHLSQTPAGVQLQPIAPSPQSTGKRFFTISLPTEAPLTIQEQVLRTYLAAIQKEHPDDDLYLVGHSAGGVLARLFMVRQPDISVQALITVASPNLGSSLAETGVTVGNSPLAWVAPMFGANTLNRSQALYRELIRERPGSLLYWLNRQPHPKVRYVSLIHGEDDVVALQSQNLRRVVALRNSAQSWILPAEHGLLAQDGELIAWVLNSDIESK